MGKSVYRAGVVVDGDYKNLNVYKQDNNSFIIVRNDENGKIIVNSLFPTNFTVVKVISKATVDRYEELSASKQGADLGAVAKGLFWLGPVGGLLGAATSQSTSFDIAVYFKNGEKSLIRILDSTYYQELKRILFSFW